MQSPHRKGQPGYRLTTSEEADPARGFLAAERKDERSQQESLRVVTHSGVQLNPHNL